MLDRRIGQTLPFRRDLCRISATAEYSSTVKPYTLRIAQALFQESDVLPGPVSAGPSPLIPTRSIDLQGKNITIRANSLEEIAAIEGDRFTVPADY